MRYIISGILLLIISTSVIISAFYIGQDNHKPQSYDLKYPSPFGKPDIPIDNPLTKEGVFLGRLLFYDPILSVDRRISCAGCHKQELAFTDGLPLAISVYGDTLRRNTMSLVNLAWSKHFFWDGRDTTLEQSITDHLLDPKEMGGASEAKLDMRLKTHAYYPILFKKAFPQDTISLKTITKALAQFTRIIVAQLKKEDTVPEDFKSKLNFAEGLSSKLISENSITGSVVRTSLMPCKSCHTTDAMGGQLIATALDGSPLKVPTLMNLKYTGPYMHDGRFKTLREVFQYYNDNLPELLSKNAKIKNYRPDYPKFSEYDLAHADEIFGDFGDSTILTDPMYANPFTDKGFDWLGIDY